jgi:hypothetical protein
MGAVSNLKTPSQLGQSYVRCIDMNKIVHKTETRQSISIFFCQSVCQILYISIGSKLMLC